MVTASRKTGTAYNQVGVCKQGTYGCDKPQEEDESRLPLNISLQMDWQAWPPCHKR